MRLDFQPLTGDLVAGCIDFNRRLREKTDAYFTLPEDLKPHPVDGAVRSSHWIAVDETKTVRGGVLLQEQRGWIDGAEVPLTNIQSPITEGIFDRSYATVAVHMMKFVEARTPYSYAVGIGSAEAPFARLLKAGGWTVAANPFFVSIERAGRVLAGLPMFRQGRKMVPASVLAHTGLADAAAAALRLARRARPRPGVVLSRTADWNPDDLDRIWRQCRDAMTFSSVRDAAGVAGLHPLSQPRLVRFALKERGEVTGWSIARVTDMNNNPYFGNLRVATILDALAYPSDRLPDLLALTQRELRATQADIIVANQCHSSWAGPLRQLGFFERPSNYMLALSKALRGTAKSGLGQLYVTRADGDGRLNL